MDRCSKLIAATLVPSPLITLGLVDMIFIILAVITRPRTRQVSIAKLRFAVYLPPNYNYVATEPKH